MKFEEVAEFEVGQVFYENGYGHSVRFELVSKPVIKEGVQLHFKGVGVDGEVSFMIHRNFPHYGPDISLEPQYVNIEEVLKWI